MSADLRSQIREFIVLNFLDGGDAEQLQDDVSLEQAHIVDSARMMELILFLEETFDIAVDNEEAIPENFDTVNNLVAFAEKKRGA